MSSFLITQVSAKKKKKKKRKTQIGTSGIDKREEGKQGHMLSHETAFQIQVVLEMHAASLTGREADVDSYFSKTGL